MSTINDSTPSVPSVTVNSTSVSAEDVKSSNKNDARRRLCDHLSSISQTIFLNKDLFLDRFFNEHSVRSNITCVYFAGTHCYVQYNDEGLVDHEEWLNIWLVFGWIDTLPQSLTTAGEGS